MTTSPTTHPPASLESCRRGDCRDVRPGDPTAGEAWRQTPDAGLDSILVWPGARWDLDPVSALREWRRTLKDGGTLAVDLSAEAGAASALNFVNLLNLVGGFFHGAMLPSGEDRFLITATRSPIAQIRVPFAVHGEAFARAAQATKGRAELYFQVATVLLQAGDADS